MRVSPDFIIPGASKSGTTSLHYYLNEHEDIFLPEEKELRFFDINTNYSKGKEYYESLFREGEESEAVGEISPSYFHHGAVYDGRSYKDYKWNPENDAATRIKDTYPDIKLIITLRNPASRAYSQYWKNYRQGRERASSFSEAIREEIDGERDHRKGKYRVYMYPNTYSTHIRHWLDLFNRDQLMFVIFEEWVGSPNETLNKICDFLGVEQRDSWSRSQESKNTGGVPRVVFLNRIYQRYVQGTPLATALRKTKVTHVLDSLNTSEGYPNMTNEEKRLMEDVFRKEISETEELIDKNLRVWRDELSV